MSEFEKLYRGFHNIYGYDVSNSLFIQRQTANTAQGNKMLSILSLKCEHANNVHMCDGEEKKRVSKMATQ